MSWRWGGQVAADDTTEGKTLFSFGTGSRAPVPTRCQAASALVVPDLPHARTHMGDIIEIRLHKLHQEQVDQDRQKATLAYRASLLFPVFHQSAWHRHTALHTAAGRDETTTLGWPGPPGPPGPFSHGNLFMRCVTTYCTAPKHRTAGPAGPARACAWSARAFVSFHTCCGHCCSYTSYETQSSAVRKAVVVPYDQPRPALPSPALPFHTVKKKS